MPNASERHERQVAALVARGARVNGFMRTMRDLVVGDDCSLDDWRADTSDLRIIPDAFDVDHDEGVVYAFEVEVTSQLTEEKMARYIRLWWALDQYEWTLVVVCVDVNGGAAPVDPFMVDMELLTARAA